MPLAQLRPALACLLATALISSVAATFEPPTGIPHADALLLLTAGNCRFAAGESIHFQQDPLRRSETARNGQTPFAAILTCSDSRVSPELIFDQGIGCLFVVRVAGNVAQTDEVASLEYAVNHLGTRLVVVLGHTKCGAVTAVVDGAITDPNLEKLVKPIEPAVAQVLDATPALSGPALLDAAIRANVAQAIADILRLSPSLTLAVTRGQVRIVGAIYDIESGKVQFLENAPLPPPIPAGAPADDDMELAEPHR
jgi:carbonic anhydrase